MGRGTFWAPSILAFVGERESYNPARAGCNRESVSLNSNQSCEIHFQVTEIVTDDSDSKSYSQRINLSTIIKPVAGR
jgi:type IV secretory pathway component VirB8